MGTLTKLKDLAGRAGRWLGLAQPPAQHTHAVVADRFDQMSWQETYDTAPALRELDEELSQRHDYADDLLADVWTAAYKTAPQLREAAQIAQSRRINHQTVASLLAAPEFDELRRHTAGDAYAAAMAVISQQDRLTRLLQQAEDAQQAAEAAEAANHEAAEAADRVRQALEAAAETAEHDDAGDTAVGGAQAEAVEQAIAAAEAADQAAATAADQARAALAQAAPKMRATIRAAAADAADQLAEQAVMMAAWGIGPGQLQRMDFATRHALAQRLAGGRLAGFAELIGRFRTMAAGERARHIEGAPGELVGITLGNDPARAIPSEVASLGVPVLRAVFAAKLAENRLMIYQTRGEQSAGKGAIIALVDCSGSMSAPGPGGVTGEAWAKACALALLDQARNSRPCRDFTAICFSSAGEQQAFHFPADQVVAIDQVADFAEHFFAGGTDFATPLTAAAQLLEAELQASGKQRGDIVLITDGECGVTEDWMRRWNETKTRLAFRVFGIAAGTRPGPVLEALADNLHTVTDLTDPATTRDMFRVI
jgi:uncharacterized protein with von Willebrand factor type A (vWA) domain